MGTTVHDKGARLLLDDMLKEPERALLLVDIKRRASLPSGHPLAFDSVYVDYVGQMWGPQSTLAKWPMEQQAAFAQIHAEICDGLISWVDISVDEKPSKDEHRHENQAKLSDLPHPFVAEVDQQQNCADQDGELRWPEPIRLQKTIGIPFLSPCRLNVKEGINLHHREQPGSAALEIGYTKASRTLAHLREHGAVARWPYGSDTIRLFMCEPAIYRFGRELEKALAKLDRERAERLGS